MSNLDFAVGWQPKWKIEKYASDADVTANKPFDVSEFEGNGILDNGGLMMWNAITGKAALVSKFDTAGAGGSAALGVGNGTTAFSAAQTGLVGASTKFVACDSVSLSTRVATFVSTFGSADANFAWEEFAVANTTNNATTTSGVTGRINRMLSAQGTKASGQTWVLTLTITLS